MIVQLDGTPPDARFPDPERAEREPDGLLAVGGDLSPERLITAYSQGVFPWYAENQPVLWWSPDPRTLLYPAKLHVSRSLARRIRKGGLTLRIDSAFGAVMQACAGPRRNQDGTWILPEMQQAYQALHELGLAHSIELWQEQTLVGGLYGVSLGAAFFGESMFNRITDASKIVMVYLCQQMLAHGFDFLDCQVYNPHLGRMGAEQVPRHRFLLQLQSALLSGSDQQIWSLPACDCSTVTTPS